MDHAGGEGRSLHTGRIDPRCRRRRNRSPSTSRFFPRTSLPSGASSRKRRPFLGGSTDTSPRVRFCLRPIKVAGKSPCEDGGRFRTPRVAHRETGARETLLRPGPVPSSCTVHALVQCAETPKKRSWLRVRNISKRRLVFRGSGGAHPGRGGHHVSVRGWKCFPRGVEMLRCAPSMLTKGCATQRPEHQRNEARTRRFILA